MSTDSHFLREALALARAGMDSGLGGPFGAVVVHDGRIVGRGENRVTSDNDPTAHAEIVAIREACIRLKRFDLHGATIYTSCEPCPMCLGAVLWARIDRVVFAGNRDDAALAGFDDAAFFREISNPQRITMCAGPHAERSVAQELFHRWRSKKDRVDY
jgi:tRNA(Arg) A34 adenosine deaminase TadA